MNKLFNLCAIAVLTAISLLSQSQVITSDAPNFDPHSSYSYVSGNNTYLCMTRSASAPSSIVTMTAASNASAAVITATGHGFHADSSPTVTFSGATGNWLPMNGTFTATYINANSFSIPLNSTSFGSLTGTVVLQTSAPRLTQAVWSIMKIVNVSSVFSSKTWAQGGLNACTDRATLSYQ